jgi:hypothetical protein
MFTLLMCPVIGVEKRGKKYTEEDKEVHVLHLQILGRLG